jgi:hypothetical protein
MPQTIFLFVLFSSDAFARGGGGHSSCHRNCFGWVPTTLLAVGAIALIIYGTFQLIMAFGRETRRWNEADKNPSYTRGHVLKAGASLGIAGVIIYFAGETLFAGLFFLMFIALLVFLFGRR